MNSIVPVYDPTNTLFVRESWEVAFGLEFEAACVARGQHRKVLQLDKRAADLQEEIFFRTRQHDYEKARDAGSEGREVTVEADMVFEDLRNVIVPFLVLANHVRMGVERTLVQRFAAKRRNGERLDRDELAAEARIGTEVYVLRPEAERTARYFEMDGAFDSTRAIQERLRGSVLFMYEL
jgi:hypothetical protein